MKILVFESALSFSSGVWVLNSWTDISTADPGPERITETHLDRISIVSHVGVHYGRDMAGFFVKQKASSTRRIIGILTELTILERDTRTIATSDCKLLEIATKAEVVLDVEREAKMVKDLKAPGA